MLQLIIVLGEDPLRKFEIETKVLNIFRRVKEHVRMISQEA